MIDKKLKYKNIKGQKHMLAYITPGEAKQLEKLGGQKIMTKEGIPAYPPDNDARGQSTGKSSTSNTSSNSDNDNRDTYRMSPSFNTRTTPAPKTTTPTFTGPSELGTSTRTADRITAPTAYEIIGGEKFDVTPDTKDDRERAIVKKSILDAPIPNITDKGTSFFKDENLLNSFLPGDNPLSKPKFSMGNLLLNAGMFAINPVLYAKYNKAKSIYKGAKFAKDLIQPYTEKNLNKPFEFIEGLTENIGLKDKNVIQSFKDSLTSNLVPKRKPILTPKRKPVINTNTDSGSNDDGIASLEKMDLLQNEYTTLLQKGNLNDEEQVRFNMLKNMLGI